MTISRRTALLGAAAAVSFAAPVAMAKCRNRADGDPLLSLETQFRQADRDWSAALDNEVHTQEAADRFWLLDNQMAAAVPVNLDGVAAKLRYLKWDAHISCNRRAEEAARTAVEGLERIMRLAGEMGS